MGKFSYGLDVGSGLGEAGEDCTDVGARLHRDDAELIFFVDPHEEGLIVVVEDASALGPVAVAVTGFEESITLFKEEMVGDELVALGIGHGAERVESTSELALESVTSLNDLLLDFITLLACDSWAKRVRSKVTTDADAGRFDHRGILSREGWALKLGVIHVRNMESILSVAMVLLNDLIEHRSKGTIGIVTSSVYADTGVGVLST